MNVRGEALGSAVLMVATISAPGLSGLKSCEMENLKIKSWVCPVDIVTGPKLEPCASTISHGGRFVTVSETPTKSEVPPSTLETGKVNSPVDPGKGMSNKCKAWESSEKPPSRKAASANL